MAPEKLCSLNNLKEQQQQNPITGNFRDQEITHKNAEKNVNN